MFTLIRYNIEKNHYAMIIINRSLSRSLNGFITDGDLFENGNHKKAFLWQSSTYKEIKTMVFDNLKYRNIKLESAYEYSGMPWEPCYNDKLRDLNIFKAYNSNLT